MADLDDVIANLRDSMLTTAWSQIDKGDDAATTIAIIVTKDIRTGSPFMSLDGTVVEHMVAWLFPGHFENDAQKEAIIELAKAMCVAGEAAAAIIVSDMWLCRQNGERESAVMARVERGHDRSVETTAHIYVREDDGKGTRHRKETWKRSFHPDDDTRELINLMPRVTPTAAQIEAARSEMRNKPMLQQRAQA